MVAARVLRHLATNHIFREVAPDYFKHNMISSVLDTGKDVSAIQRECVLQASDLGFGAQIHIFPVLSQNSTTPTVSLRLFRSCTRLILCTFLACADSHALFSAEDGFKAGAFLPDTLADPEASRSQEPAEASFQRAVGFEGTRFEYFDRPENLLAFKRYGAAMVGSAKVQVPSALLGG